ncbi:MAG: bifunctional DNA-formamidopyrimidine glycosylase/DNA-(apurinic or apyrimidinic site) lyase [Candidatus Andersenbacteria bacterium]|nr:bifunctional DNA-formamidopyrimidine glycosylase/DNA-(apurinic or apyrimidinic site) lyase [Candidatus Andersenbacteria bacterium]
MPELPEVETIRIGLTKRMLNVTITDVEVRKAKIVRGRAKKFIAGLTGQKFSSISRRGKLLIFHVAGVEAYMLVHLKMTGQLIYEKGGMKIAGGHSWPSLKDPLPNKYSHVVMRFADGGTLFFNDMRQFGYMELADVKRLQEVLDVFGPEPLEPDFTFEVLNQMLGKRTTAIKAALLNQTVLAGVGNIYADESLFVAGIKPTRRVNSLTVVEKKALFKAIPAMLLRALKFGGTTFSDYVDVEGKKGNFTRLLKVYGRGGQVCLKCKKTKLTKATVAGRGTVWCAYCQH